MSLSKNAGLIISMSFILGACSPTPMNEGTAKAFQKCLDKDWVPDYFSNAGQIDFECSPKTEAIPMNNETQLTYQACLTQDNNAIYNGEDGSFYCVEHGADLRIK